MTWSKLEALEYEKKALRSLLNDDTSDFTRSLKFRQPPPDIPEALWSKLSEAKFADSFAPGGLKYRLTVAGWIRACCLLRDEIDLNRRFGKLSAHLKGLASSRTSTDTTPHAVAQATGLSFEWVIDSIQGQMAEAIFKQHGAKLHFNSIEIPAHIGNKISNPDAHTSY